MPTTACKFFSVSGFYLNSWKNPTWVAPFLSPSTTTQNLALSIPCIYSLPFFSLFDIHYSTQQTGLYGFLLILCRIDFYFKRFLFSYVLKDEVAQAYLEILDNAPSAIVGSYMSWSSDEHTTLFFKWQLYNRLHMQRMQGYMLALLAWSGPLSQRHCSTSHMVYVAPSCCSGAHISLALEWPQP